MRRVRAVPRTAKGSSGVHGTPVRRWGMGRRPTTGYESEEIPDHMPPANQGAIPVIVRLVDDEHGEHYRPAEARHWTETHVMVGIYGADPDTGRCKDRLAWLRAVHPLLVLGRRDTRHHGPDPRPRWSQPRPTWRSHQRDDGAVENHHQRGRGGRI